MTPRKIIHKNLHDKLSRLRLNRQLSRPIGMYTVA